MAGLHEADHLMWQACKNGILQGESPKLANSKAEGCLPLQQCCQQMTYCLQHLYRMQQQRAFEY